LHWICLAEIIYFADAHSTGGASSKHRHYIESSTGGPQPIEQNAVNTMSSSQGIPSNNASAAATLQNRRIKWIGLSNDAIEEQRSTTISFKTEWEKLAHQCGSGTTSDAAWDYFSEVIEMEHDKETDFDVKLFGALKNSLGDVADQVVIDKRFSIRRDNSHSPPSNRQIGFCRQPSRPCTGLGKDYGAVREYFMDHVCFVEDSTDRRSTVWDWTAVIELKIGNTGPKKFVTRANGLIEVVTREPNLAGVHGAIGQALLYTLDTWHCLARRGIEVKKLPITVLTGRKNGSNKETPENLLCVDAWLHIPEYPEDSFNYTIDSFLPFPSASASQGDKTDIYKHAIAVYLRTLGFGMQHGQRTLEGNDARPPISLCCRKLKLGDKEFTTAEAQLIASPIPKSVPIGAGFKISQGELFKLTSTDSYSLLQLFGAENNLNELTSIVVGFAPENCIIVADRILIKVSCVSVHSVLIPLAQFEIALQTLLRRADETLKSKIAEVLLAVVLGDNTLVTVMRNLSSNTTENGAYSILSPSKIYREDNRKLKQLWIGLTKLVVDILLPLAELNIIHSDIRPGWDTTYNILCREVEGSEIELQLIDYESLHMEKYGVTNSQTISSARQTANSKGKTKMNAKEYLLWLILWTAYNWHQQHHASTDSEMFVSMLFTSEQPIFMSFINNIQSRGNWEEIQGIFFKEKFDDTSIKETLTILGNLFNAPDDN
jgi:hypothetical protein